MVLATSMPNMVLLKESAPNTIYIALTAPTTGTTAPFCRLSLTTSHHFEWRNNPTGRDRGDRVYAELYNKSSKGWREDNKARILLTVVLPYHHCPGVRYLLLLPSHSCKGNREGKEQYLLLRRSPGFCSRSIFDLFTLNTHIQCPSFKVVTMGQSPSPS